MELLYELLREACTYFLLSFLVVRFLSLIVSTSDADSFSGLKGVKNSSKIGHSFGGHEFKEVNDDVNTHNNKINVELEELIFRDIDIVSSEVNAIDDEDFLKRCYLDVVDDQEVKKLVEIGGELIDREKEFVGFKDKVGGELESGKNIAIVDQIQDSNLEFEDCTSNNEILGREEVEGEVERLRNVYKGEVSGREFEVEKGVLIDDDEEWEGIERSELEKSFARAMNLVECKEKQELLVQKRGNDVMMQFYGLQKIAMEGRCHEPQPMAIKRTARAKWNAWKNLGSMTREDAMEQYIRLLSDIIPKWMEDDSTLSTIKGKSSSSMTALENSPEAN